MSPKDIIQIKKEKLRCVFWGIGLSLLFVINIFGQSSDPVRTEWRSPNGSKPMTFQEWKAKWNAEPKQVGGEIKYRTPALESAKSDSFVFGDDYAYYKGYVMHSNGALCKELPPIASFIVILNGDDSKILTDDSPRWELGDPNISGMGWYGIELGNFSNPEVAVGDSFEIIFSCYNPGEQFEQGVMEDSIVGLPFPPAFPTTLYLQNAQIPLPPDSLRLFKDGSQMEIYWRQLPGLKYTVYRRCLADTLALNFPRYQYEKIAENIVDSCYVDSAIDTTEYYGYLIFCEDISSGLKSGRSREINNSEEPLEVRAIFVQPELYTAIETNLMQMVTDWESECDGVIVYAMQFSDSLAFRDTLKSIEGLQGALLIGKFPVPWYQQCDDNGEHYQEYPVDLYYMDLDGIWEDNYHYVSGVGLVPGPDGIFDTHTADFPRNDEAPEIVIGRILPTAGMGDPEEIINNYLYKCYRYRHDIGDIRQEFRALAYPDDDWHNWGHDVAVDYLSQAYPEYDCVWDINATTATEYGNRLGSHYSLIHVYVHSWSQGHAFSVNNGTQSQYFYNTQILPVGTDANFFLLFACGNCRYIEDRNCGAIYALQTQAGINTIGTTHSGGMLDYDYFYPALAEGIAYGEAYLRTYQHVGDGGFSQGAKGWYYGLTFNGDPFIVPQPHGTTGIAEGENNSLPTTISLANYPNPFNPVTCIEYTVPEAGYLELIVYNTLGQKIRTLIKKQSPAGNYKVIWDGKNDAGKQVPSGMYFYRLKTGKGTTLLKKMLLLK